MSGRQNKVAKGTYVTFAGVRITDVQSIKPNLGGTSVDMTNLDDDTAIFEAGKPSPKFVVTAKHAAALTQYAKGDVIVTYPGGNTREIRNAMLESIDEDATDGNSLMSTYTFVPSTGTGS